MSKLKVKNWEQFQHYRDRNPPWIKLHFSMLSSQDWVTLDDASRVLAIACMLIASRNGGYVPTDPAYIKRVAYLNKAPNFKPLIDCGFLESASGCKQMLADARPETETETETDRVANPTGFEEFWCIYPRKKSKGQAEKAWKHLSPDGALRGSILDALERAKTSSDWRREGGKFIPYPATWLNARGWEDELQPAMRENFHL